LIDLYLNGTDLIQSPDLHILLISKNGSM